MKNIKKLVKTLLEIIEGILMLCWALYSPIWMCMIAYNGVCYAEYGEVATPYSIIIVATVLFVVNVIWLNHMIDKTEKGGRNNG